ncbi:hypothetical protein AXA44_20170 [Rhodococcus sp. SC4]|nr:hypothetical protein AXA44_20170 [Rhodococcus sp. SC4]
MKSARNTLPDEPPNALTCGIDWARDDHAVSVVDARGREVHRCTVEHSATGLRELLTVLARTGVCEVAIERPDGPVIDTLLGAGIAVVVISPSTGCSRPAQVPASFAMCSTQSACAFWLACRCSRSHATSRRSRIASANDVAVRSHHTGTGRCNDATTT